MSRHGFLLSVNNLSVYHGTICALWGVSLRVHPKTITSIIGSNGAGKSTILTALAGLLRPASGSIIFEDTDVTALDPSQRVELGMSLVPEGRRLFSHLNVQDNLELGAYTNRARHSLKSSIGWAFQLFPILESRRSQLAGTLSGGEQQMLAIARGLMSRPKLLMLDEPTVGLSPLFANNLFETLKAIKNEGITILLVEQNVRRAVMISDKAFLLESGRVISEGSRELLQDDHLRTAYLGL